MLDIIFFPLTVSLMDWHNVKMPPIISKPSHLGFGIASCPSECKINGDDENSFFFMRNSLHAYTAHFPQGFQSH